jgi:cephalosporin-C deacetylase-like acetyl esterase
MTRSRWRARLAFGAIVLAAQGSVAEELAFAERARAFDYDATAALDVQERSLETVDGVTVHDFTYASPKGGRVPAYLLVAPGPGRRARRLFNHRGHGTRSELLGEGVAAARAGAVCLMIDAPYHRDEFQGPTGMGNPDGERALFVQLVIDLRRGLDLLVARPDVDAGRLGYVGHSLGATWGGALVGVDHRLRAAVLMGGLPSLTDPTHSYTDEFWAIFREQYGEEKIRAYQAVIGPIDPEHFVSHAAPTRLLFQFARRDRFISDAAAKAYAAAASAPKEVRWYFTGHELNDQASLRDRAQWLSLQLRTRPIWPELQRASKQP